MFHPDTIDPKALARACGVTVATAPRRWVGDFIQAVRAGIGWGSIFHGGK